MRSGRDALAPFHPVIRDWFAARLGEPTEVQRRAWPAIVAGEHVLVTAPTGSGKTLAAFLFAVDQLLSGGWPPGGVRALYISPLKALNTDIRRNLLGPLAELRERFAAAGLAAPTVAVETRSGDTPAAERRRMLRRPPEIFITTPESLNLLLASASARALFGGLQTVILDEIHAVAGSKRGTHLITAVDRLTRIAGEFQRVALSATVRPLATMAEFVGGYTIVAQEPTPAYSPRPVTIVRAPDTKAYEATVRYPEAALEPDGWWAQLAAELKAIVVGHRSTLIFTNSRALCERLALLLNRDEPTPLVYSHHGSLARETRQIVEERLKAGELRGIVATSSLELGIDIGALDAVVLVQTPVSVASALQRLGRAGHGVGQVSRGALLPTHSRDLVDAVVMARCVAARDIAPLRPPQAPLDVLAQVIVAMTAVETWSVEALYAFLRTSWPYRRLSRQQFDLVLEMLAGRYAETRVPALAARIVWDRIEGTLRARDPAVKLVLSAGGTIPDRGYLTLRHAQSRSRIGELDEEFVWERRVGDTFIFGSQAWRIEQITHNDVLVLPADAVGMAPFWRGEQLVRDAHFSKRLGEFLEWADPRLDDPDFVAALKAEYALTSPAANALAEMLRRQRAATEAALPHRHHVLIEEVESATGVGGQVIFHTLWGAPLNRPLALLLAGANEERSGARLELFGDNDCVVLLPPAALDGAALLTGLDPDRLEQRLRGTLQTSALFGARFRENATRALLLPRGMPGRRVPLWLTRERAKKLLEAVGRYDDFPIVVETWRTCLQDEFDLPLLRERLAELRDGAITVTVVRTSEPSPFAAGVAWGQTNRLMYADDSPSGGPSRLRWDLVREVALSPELRPELPPDLVSAFAARLQRTWPGYAPGDAGELLEHVKDWLILSLDEWEALLAAMARDGGHDEAALRAAVRERIVRVTLPGAEPAVAALEMVPRLAAAVGVERATVAVDSLAGGPPPALDDDQWRRLTPDSDVDLLADVVAQWLALYGPVPPAQLAVRLGVASEVLDSAATGLIEAERVVADRLTQGAESIEWCDAEHLERLLRLARQARAPVFTPLPATRLAPFLASWQGLMPRGEGEAGLQRAIEPLLGLPAPAALWEAEILPARVAGYRPALLDQVMANSDVLWYGCGERQVAFGFPDLLDALTDEQAEIDLDDEPPVPPGGRYGFAHLLRLHGQPSGELAAALWRAVWAGRVANDGFAALRHGIATRFRAASPEPGERGSGHRGRIGFDRWRTSRPFEGRWYRLPVAASPADPIERLERDKDRVRLLLDRYGVLCRELLAREAPPFGWSRLFRAIRLMELSGELLAGQFFEGLAGPQWVAPETLDRLAAEPPDAVWWLNACDPASLCGAKIAGLRDLPERRPTTHIVYHGERVVMVSHRLGRQITFAIEPDDPVVGDCLRLFAELQDRAVEPLRSITVDSINGQPARWSPYLPAFEARFDVIADDRRVRLWRRANR